MKKYITLGFMILASNIILAGPPKKTKPQPKTAIEICQDVGIPQHELQAVGLMDRVHDFIRGWHSLLNLPGAFYEGTPGRSASLEHQRRYNAWQNGWNRRWNYWGTIYDKFLVDLGNEYHARIEAQRKQAEAEQRKKEEARKKAEQERLALEQKRLKAEQERLALEQKREAALKQEQTQLGAMQAEMLALKQQQTQMGAMQAEILALRQQLTANQEREVRMQEELAQTRVAQAEMLASSQQFASDWAQIMLPTDDIEQIDKQIGTIERLVNNDLMKQRSLFAVWAPTFLNKITEIKSIITAIKPFYLDSPEPEMVRQRVEAIEKRIESLINNAH